MTEQATKHEFQAEVAQLLHLVTHSLYSNPDIFLRELISNASDACDKLRYAAIDDDSLYGDDPELKVRITLDKEAKTLTIIDNGIGMNEADAIDNLGTIAKSGTKAFLDQLEANKKGDAGLIGQFGVGFYSSFIVADKVTVESRKAGETSDKAIRWESGGSGAFTITPIERAERGTAITLHLTEEHEGYLERHKLKQLVSKYSDHISLPIQMKKEEWVEGEEDAEGNKAEGKMVELDEWETTNKASALWTRDKSDITDEEYTEFYKNLSYAMDEPLTWTHNRVEGNQQYTQLLYIPSKAPMDLYHREQQHGLKLYVKRVFIMDDAEQLLPMYLRFIKGVIDSSDLPLNVSREILQESRDVKSIREGNARRILVTLDKLANSEDASDKEKYAKFYTEFGAVLKEGLGEDMKNQERIAKLLRFASVGSDAQDKSLEDYKSAMKDGQKAIYYITADSLAAAKNSPQLELFKKKGIDVLFLTDRVDEWAMSFLTQFDGTPLQNIAKGAVDLGELQDEAEKEAAEKASEEMKPVVEKLETALKERAKNVRVSTRLVDSPACIVVSDGEMTPQMVQMLKSMGQEVPDIKPTLEINAEHPLVKRLENSEQFDDLAQVIFDQAMLAEGAALEDPAGYLKRVNALLMK